MAHCYEFAIIRLAPDDARNESINVGAVVLTKHGLDIRLAKRLEKVHAISAAIETSELRYLTENLKTLYEYLPMSDQEGSPLVGGLPEIPPLAFSNSGTFVAENSNEYEDRIASIMRAFVDAEPASRRIREKRSKLLTQVKTEFRKEKVLAKKDEQLDSHRIVPGFELDQGLIADLVLKNGHYHVVETVDASGEDETLRHAIADIGVSCLVLERARMKFGKGTVSRLVYSASASLEKITQPSLDAAANQGATLTNWASADDRAKFVHALSSMASPFPLKRKRGRVRFSSGQSSLI